MTNRSYLYSLPYAKAILLFLALFSLSFSIQAQTDWTGTLDSDWTNAANWTAGVPDAADAVIITTGATNDPTISAGTAAIALDVRVQIGKTLSISATASLTLGSTVGGAGLYSDGSVVNEGTLNVINSTFAGIGLGVTGNFVNRGDIFIGQGGLIDVVGIITFPGSTFTNEAGQIIIDNTTGDAIQNQTTFINQATILIGQNDGNIGRFGILAGLSGSSTTNEITGTITINNTSNNAIHGQTSATILNQGSIDIGVNVLGGINIGSSTTFTNAECATVSTFADIVGGSPFTNNGFITLDNASITNTAFTNNGVIIDVQGTAGTTYTNNSVSITPIATCSDIFNNALNSSIPNNLTVGNQWFFSDNLITEAGTYNAVTDVFTPDVSLPLGISTLYFSITDNVNNCAQTVSIEVDFGNNTSIWTGAVSTDWHNEDNWQGCVPDVNTTALIGTTAPNATIIPAGTAAVARNIVVQSAGSLTVMATATLSLDISAMNPGVAVALSLEGSVVNEGTIDILGATLDGIEIYNAGNFINRGNTLIGQNGGNIGRFGINAFGTSTFINESGQILIDNVSSHAIENRANFTNQADLLIGQNGGNITGLGVSTYDAANFINAAGQIVIDNTGSHAIQNQAIFTNQSDLLVGQNNGNIGGVGLLNNGAASFTNQAGQVLIDNTAFYALQNFATFTNQANILIGQNGGNIGDTGIFSLAPGSFTNEAGQIIIDNTAGNGILNSTLFTNKANILIGQNDGNILNGGINTTAGSNFTNESGQIVIDNTVGVAILNRDVFTNQAIISIGQNDGNIGNTGIFSRVSGAFTNAAGQIYIDNTGTTAIHSDGTFLNQADIFIGQNGGNITFSGIVNQAGTFTHQAGQIVIDNVGLYGIAQLSSGAFTNQSDILIGQNDGNITRDGIWNAGSNIFNNETGQISIDNTGHNGILNSGPFFNQADIFIGQNGGNITRSGINTTPGSSFIHKTGQILIDNTLDAGIINREVFNNQSIISIGQNDGNIGTLGIALISDSNFTNTPSGTIDIKNTALQAIGGQQTDAVMLNQGIIKIDDDAVLNFVANASFTNDNCATVSTLGDITGDAAITNNGYLTIDGGAITNTAFTNNGIIIDVQGTTGTAYTNNSLSVAPIVTCNGVFDNVFNTTNPNNFTLGSQWYLNDDLTGLAGAYDAATNVFTPAASLPNGLTTLYFSASDDANACTETVSINIDLSVDITPPVIVCPASVSVNAPASDCFAEIGFASPTATDSCDPNPTIVLTSGTASGNSFDIGTVTNTYTATDASNNMSSCTMMITVVDNTNPTPICQDAIVVLDAAGNSSITTTIIDNGSNDACDIASLSLNMTEFTCANVGDNTVTLTVTDNNGNTSTCTSTVDVQDNTNPTPICQDAIVVLDAAGNGSITTTEIDNLSNDACGIASLSLDITSFTCADVGDNTVTLTVTDNNGNFDTCTATVDVQDNTNPNPICQDAIVVLNAAGNGSITTTTIDNGSNDACEIASLSLDVTAFTCADVGDNTVTLTVTDNNGNFDTCTSTVDVQDNTNPTPTCQDITAQLDANGMATITANQIDNGSNDACGILSLSLDNENFSCNEVGNNTVTLTVTDVNDNSATCTTTVTVEDNIAPEVITQNITVELDNEGNVTISPDDVDNGTNDACGIASLSLNITQFSCGNVGANTVILTATDVNGNLNTESAIVTVVDALPAEIECRQPISTTVTPGQCQREDLEYV